MVLHGAQGMFPCDFNVLPSRCVMQYPFLCARVLAEGEHEESEDSRERRAARRAEARERRAMAGAAAGGGSGRAARRAKRARRDPDAGDALSSEDEEEDRDGGSMSEVGRVVRFQCMHHCQDGDPGHRHAAPCRCMS